MDEYTNNNLSNNTAIAQDDARQRQIAIHCNLIISNRRIGTDAIDSVGNIYELKSATNKKYISTARDFNLETLQKYRSQYWILAGGQLTIDASSTKFYTIEELYCAHPTQLEFFFSAQETKLNTKVKMCKLAMDVIELSTMNTTDKHAIHDILLFGSKLNNPKINMNKIRTICTKLDSVNSSIATEQLQEFVYRNPLP